MPLLRDAFTYSQALLRGEKNPSKAVADDRAISVRTAQGRIAKARALNLLTAARPGQRIGELTPFAIDLLRRWYGTDLAVHGEIRGFGAVAKDARGSPDTEGAEDG